MTPLELVDGSQVTQRALTYPDQARALTIRDAKSYEAACDFLKGIKALRGEIADTFDPHVKRAFEAHRALCKEKQDAERPLTEAERIVKDAIRAYDDEQERIRREEQRRLQEEARQREEERRLEEAIALDQEAAATGDAGKHLEAEAILAQPITVPVVAVAPVTPKVTGISFRETWSGRVTDLAALIRYAAANPQFMTLLQVNQPVLNGLARSLKNNLKVPGVDVVCVKDVAASRR